jgi:hypothetical protein
MLPILPSYSIMWQVKNQKIEFKSLKFVVELVVAVNFCYFFMFDLNLPTRLFFLHLSKNTCLGKALAKDVIVSEY